MSFTRLAVGSGLVCLMVLAGCGTQTGSGGASHAVSRVAGHVFGGQQPVAFATVQLYAVGTSGDGSAATPLLTQTVTTDVNGEFSLSPNGTPLYSCNNATEVYITATGGQPLTGTANPNLALMTALRPCSALTTGTFIAINELTTVAAVNALAPYMSSDTGVGSGTADSEALDAAFALADELVNSSSGVVPGPGVPSGYAVPVSEIDTLGDVIGACLNSVGGIAGSSGACGQIFSLTTPDGSTPPADTITALLDLAKNPTLNTTALFDVAFANPPFQPTLGEPPANFAVNLSPTSALQISPSGLGFPSEAVGNSSPSETVTLTNTGSTAVSISSVALTGPNAGDFAVGSCPASLAALATCNLAVSFTPTGYGPRSASIMVATSGVSSSTTYLPLTGVGINSSGNLFASPAALVFYPGQIGMTAAQTVALVNAGSSSVTLGTISFSGADSDFSQANNCPALLSAGSACTISVVVTESTTSTESANLLIASSAPGSPLSVGLTENTLGTAGPVSFSTTSLSMANFSSSPVNLTNNGSVPLVISSIDVTAGFAQQNTCGSSLAVGASCTITVTPAYTVAGPFTGSLVVADDAASSPQSLPISTTNDFETPLVSFGSAIVGTTSPATYSFTVPSGYNPVTITTTGPDPNDFLVSLSPSHCVSQAPVSCVVSIGFSPTAAGTRAAAITVTGNGGVYVAATGTGVAGSGPLPTFVPDANGAHGISSTIEGLLSISANTSETVSGSIYNVGTTALSFAGSAVMTFTGPNASEFTYVSSASACGSVAVGASCAVDFTFSPLGSGLRQATMNLYDSISGTTLQIPVAIYAR